MRRGYRRRRTDVRNGQLVVALVVMLIALGVAFPALDVTARFARAYDQFSARLGASESARLLAPENVVTVNEPDACDAALPQHGRQMRFAGIAPSHWTQQMGRLFVSNGHEYPVVLLVTDLQGEQEYQAITLYPGRGVQVQVPVGDYGLIALAGRSWCNLAQGFVNGAEVPAPQPLAIRAERAMRVGLLAYGGNPGDMMYSFSESLGAAFGEGVEGVGSLVLQRHGMHYAVAGTVNDKPLTFMVDTGASVTTVSRIFAREAELHECVPHKIQTANGIANACKAVARELSLGQFRLRDVDVSIIENPGVPLLGMNVINRFRMEQQGDVMRLSAR